MEMDGAGLPLWWDRHQLLSGAATLILCFRQYAALSTYFVAQCFKSARSSAVSVFTTLPGEPSTSEPGGTFMYCVTSDFAPIKHCSPISAPSKMIAPMPIRH